MPGTLKQVLGGKNLTGVIQSVKGGVPDGLIPPEFMSLTRPVEGATATYAKVEATRETARRQNYGGPSRQRGQQAITEVPVRLIHSLESQFHKPDTLMNLLEPGSERKQRLGRQEIARQVREFRRLFDNLRLSSIYSLLALGHVYFDGEGNLLPSASGAVVDVDYGIDCLDSDILHDWDTDATDIFAQIIAIKQQMIQNTGVPARHAFYGAGVLEHLTSNNVIQAMVGGNPNLAEAVYSRGEIPDGFAGLKWWPVYQSFYVDDDGTVQEWFGDNQVVITTEINRDVYEFLEGSYPVPTDIGAQASDATAALGNFSVETGQFSYALLTGDPPSIKQVGGDTFLPILRNPDAVCIQTDVTASP